ncbi:MAG TPA: hypothetical protein VEP91_10885 [Solirubrobacterales bacterium]|nr:hypothetical protein [Solirubrobacterales bacterium]
MPIPADLPAASLDQPVLYRLEITLLAFYGFLLLITPLHSALAWGRLPTEISTRGARFAEKADHSVKKVEAAVETLERKNRLLTEGLRTARREIRHLSDSDNTQPGVDSKR